MNGTKDRGLLGFYDATLKNDLFPFAVFWTSVLFCSFSVSLSSKKSSTLGLARKLVLLSLVCTWQEYIFLSLKRHGENRPTLGLRYVGLNYKEGNWDQLSWLAVIFIYDFLSKL